jgi:hypothetical protein
LISGVQEADGHRIPLDIDCALSVVVRVFLSINVHRSPIDMGEAVPFNPCAVWGNDKSLCAFIEAEIPKHAVKAEEASSLIKTSKLKARYLENYVGIKIKWTPHLPDHLRLDINENSKILQLFELAGFLETTFEALLDSDPDNGSPEIRQKLTLDQSLAV